MKASLKKYTEYRDEKKVSDYRVAAETGIPISTFSDWRSGRSVPGVDKLYRLAKFFETNIEDLLEEE